MGKSRSRRHHRRRGGENSLEQIIHGTESGTDKFTHTVMKEPDKFGDAISGEVMGKETRRGKAGRKVKEFGGQVTNFLKKLKFWGGRRRTRRGRRRRRTRHCRHHHRRRHTKRCRRRRSRRSRTKRRRRRR